MASQSSYLLLAQHTLHEFGVIIDLISQNMITKDLARKIDIFFYVDHNRQAKKIYSDMKDGYGQIDELYKSLCRLELAIKVRWQNDYNFIALPVSMHEFFG